MTDSTDFYRESITLLLGEVTDVDILKRLYIFTRTVADRLKERDDRQAVQDDRCE